MSETVYPHNYLYGWTGIVTVVTFIAGLLSILRGAEIVNGAYLLPDIPGGCILILLSAIFGTAYYKGRTDRPGWISFSYIGSLMLLIFAVCTVLINGGNYLGLIMGGEEGDAFTIISSTFIWAAIIAIPLYLGVSKLMYKCSCGGDCCE